MNTERAFFDVWFDVWEISNDIKRLTSYIHRSIEYRAKEYVNTGYIKGVAVATFM